MTTTDPQTPVATLQDDAARFQDCMRQLKTEIGRVFIGQPDVVDQLLLCLFCQGHALLEGAPGLGKTLLVKTLADRLSLRFSRVQCTPDLMPADIIGTNVLMEDGGGRAFRFQPGPLFAHVVLADEINRATPKTQSAFLEAMQEYRVTVFGVTHVLEQPFLVLATQNPIEMEGTYPLPEAQLDRFFFKIHIRVPTLDELARIMAITTSVPEPAARTPYGADDIRRMVALVRQVKIADEVTRVALRVMLATHPESDEATPRVRQFVRYGASPRAAQSMILAGKARALAEGRFNVGVDDLRRVALPALGHRVILNFQGEVQKVPVSEIVTEAIEAVAGRLP
jgi:MoxR-like ATPase